MFFIQVWILTESMQLHEHCGVVGVFSFDKHNVVPMLLGGLEALQHRGQEAWGIAVSERPSFKRFGVISQAVEAELKALKAGPEEMELFNYARKYATRSKEWKAWIKKAVHNLFQYKSGLTKEG